MSRYDDRLAPIFTAEMGKRLALIRMNRLMSQAEFGDLFGLSQQVYSRIEAGKQWGSERIVFSKFREALGSDLAFVMTGSGAERYAPGFIKEAYWRARLAARRSNRSPDPYSEAQRRSRALLRRKQGG